MKKSDYKAVDRGQSHFLKVYTYTEKAWMMLIVNIPLGDKNENNAFCGEKECLSVLFFSIINVSHLQVLKKNQYFLCGFKLSVRPVIKKKKITHLGQVCFKAEWVVKSEVLPTLMCIR